MFQKHFINWIFLKFQRKLPSNEKGGRDREKNGLAEKDRHRHKKKKRESELGEFECPIS